MGVWGIIQTYAEEIQDIENELIEKKDEEILEQGTKDLKILYTEADGVYFNVQGKDRKEMKEEYKKTHPNEELKRFKK
jgi:hypothetical protein